jgi:hypothetical protein
MYCLIASNPPWDKSIESDKSIELDDLDESIEFDESIDSDEFFESLESGSLDFPLDNDRIKASRSELSTDNWLN